MVDDLVINHLRAPAYRQLSDCLASPSTQSEGQAMECRIKLFDNLDKAMKDHLRDTVAIRGAGLVGGWSLAYLLVAVSRRIKAGFGPNDGRVK
ncbi:MAG TPA: hypothetical protein VGJ20_06810 [Xanthobacteraceae bacterium]